MPKKKQTSPQTSTQDASIPAPTAEEVIQPPQIDQPWNTGEAEEDAKWDGSNDQPSAEDYIRKLDNAPKFDGDWTGQSKKGSVQTSGAWDVEAVPTGKLEPKQVDWTADETGEPVPNTASEAPEKIGQEELAQIPDFAGLSTALGLSEAWEGQPEGQEQDVWEAGSAPLLTLSIERHPGKFDPNIVKLMIYGDTGTQKTRTAATFPNAIFADVDHGMSSVDWEVDKVHVDDDERGFKQLQELHRFLAEGNHDYETVVLDTLNEMQRVIMRFTVDEYTQVRRSYGSLPGQSDYGFMLYQFMELTRNFIALPMRVVLLAQVNSQQFETDTLGPQLIGKNTARELLRKMDVVGYIYKAAAEEGTHPEITFDAANYATKDRSYKLPAALPNPTFQRIAAYWK
jgi:hypothetical protein